LKKKKQISDKGGKIMEKKETELKKVKKSFWSIIKDSFNKANSGCGPGCGCHIEEKSSEDKSSANRSKE